jgi:RNA polymerase sigma-70 factor, ECF subfamily
MTSKYSLLNDRELMQLIQAGEVLAFDELYLRYSRPLLRYFTRMLNYDKEKAEDAFHDLFLKIAESPEKFDSSKSFKTWIYASAHNACKNYYKHTTIVKDAHEELQQTEGVFDENFLITAAAKMDGDTFRQTLGNVVEVLPLEKKTTFILRYQEDHPIAEIAEIMECTEGTVKSRIHYTLKILSEKLAIFNPIN